VRDYTTMDLADLKALPIAALAAEDAILALWATAPLLPEALAIVETWGFSYRTVLFTWLKTGATASASGSAATRGARASFLLLGRRGRGLPRVARDVEQVIAAPVLGHSVKPPEALERLERLFGRPEDAGPYLELFARGRRRGWHAWGDEAGPWPEDVS
jgi:N6-adenosine-specific RNA methylase IME4